jgi:hypothetical protein
MDNLTTARYQPLTGEELLAILGGFRPVQGTPSGPVAIRRSAGAPGVSGSSVNASIEENADGTLRVILPIGGGLELLFPRVRYVDP